jgi:hypothetical protein
MNLRKRALLLALSVALPLRAAENEQRLAVVITTDGDEALSNDLTEVAIAKLAALGMHRIVGARELRAQWAARRSSDGVALDLESCLESTDCCAILARAMNLSHAVVGRVQGHDSFAVEFDRVELAGGRAEAHASKSGLVGLDELIRGVTDAVGEVMVARSEAGSAPRSAAQPGPSTSPHSITAAYRATQTPPAELASPPPRVPPRTVPLTIHAAHERSSRPAPIVALTGAGLAIATFAAAAFTGSVAGGTPRGDTRAQAQADLQRRESYATATNGLLIAGAVLSGATAVAFVWHYGF